MEIDLAARLAADATRFTVPDLLRHCVARFADRIAVISPDVELTYRELDERTNRLAGVLMGLGLARGDRIAFLSTTRPEPIELYCAAAKAGVTVVALNIRARPEELVHCVELTGPRVMFASPGLAALAGEVVEASMGVERTVVFPERGGDRASEYEQLLAGASAAAVRSPAEPEDIHCILFTSGTTGRPKGAMISHRASVARAFRCADWFELGPDDGMVGWIPMFHTGGDECVKATFLKGGRFATFESPDPPSLFAAIERHRLTWTVLLPGVITDFIHHPARREHDLSSLRFALGYANMMPAVVAEFCRELDAGFWDTYGQTESSFVVALDLVRPGDVPTLRKRPAPFLAMRLIDGDGHEVPDGTPGECVLRGPSVMSGYIGNPDATAEVFADGWLHTGDLLARNDDGTLTYVDRLKYLIKTGGENVYPAEIEAVIAGHPGVQEACVLGVPDDRWGETVKAIVVADRDQGLSGADVRAWCRDRLPGFKCPRYVEFLVSDEVPRSGTGKILRAELAGRPVSEEHFVA